jgi:hypothetical protein
MKDKKGVDKEKDQKRFLQDSAYTSQNTKGDCLLFFGFKIFVIQLLAIELS